MAAGKNYISSLLEEFGFSCIDADVLVHKAIEIYSEERIKLKSEKEIYENILKRDEIDSTRKESPLKKAEDAIEVDTTSKNIEEVKNEILNIYSKYFICV